MKYRSNSTGLILLLILASGGEAHAEIEPGNWVTRNGQEEKILSLVAPNETGAPILVSAWFERIEIQREEIVFVVSGRTPPAAPVSLVLTWVAEDQDLEAPPPRHAPDFPVRLLRIVGPRGEEGTDSAL